MLTWPPKRIATLVLGLWFAFAPALYAMPAAAMLLQADVSSVAGQVNCNGCPDLDADAASCARLCLSAAFFAIFAESDHVPAVIDDGRPSVPPTVLTGRYSAPEPAPPKAALLR